VSNSFTKDSSPVLDYMIQWSRWLKGDTIQTSQWTVPAGLALLSQTNTTTTSTVWLSGGTAGQVYTVTKRITTAARRTDERSITIRVMDR